METQGLISEHVWSQISKAMSLIRDPFPQNDARHKPIMAIRTTEHAAGTA